MLGTLIALSLAACGGGSDDAQAPPSTDTPPSAAQLAVALAGSTTQNGCLDGPAASARFGSPQGIALDDAGNVLVADGDCHAVRMVAPDGRVSTFAGKLSEAGDVQGTRSLTRFKEPFGLFRDRLSGTVFVADRGAHRVLSIAASGEVTSIAGNGQAGSKTEGSANVGNDAFSVPIRFQNLMQLNNPTLIAKGSVQEGLEFVDAGNSLVGTLRTDTTAAIVSTSANSICAGLLNAPEALGLRNRLVCARGTRITIADRNGGVLVLAGSSTQADSVDGTGNAARFLGPTGVALGLGTTMLVADQDALRRVDLATAEVTTVLKEADRFGGAPRQIVVAPDGHTAFYTTAHGVVKVVLP